MWIGLITKLGFLPGVLGGGERSERSRLSMGRNEVINSPSKCNSDSISF